MANEFKHKDPGGELTQAEFVAACGDGHIFACQATGDIVYASSATVLSKLARGAANTVLSMGGSCIPAWTASPSVTDLTIGGGCITLTGAATDIDLIDNNASALSFDASGKTGIIDIVTTNCSEGVTMSGTLGVTGVLTATGGIELSHACQNTLTGSGGVLSIQGNRIFHAGGTDVPVADGGTGASCLTDGGVLLGSGTDAVTAMAVLADGEMIVGDGTTDPVAESGATLRTSIGVGTGDSPQFTDLTLTGGCITITNAATDIDLIDNNACALSFDASGQAGILAIDTQNCAEGVKMSGKLTVTGAVSTTGALTVGVDDTGHDVKFFGAAAGAYMLYDQSCDQLEIRGASADATTSTGKLLLSTSLTNVNANDVIGSINFQAPAEAGGTDAIAIAAGIRAVAQATFTCAVNSTDLIFYTGHSEAATEKFRFTSQGEIGIGGANYGTDGQVLTSTGAGTAPAWEDAAGGGGPCVANGADNRVATFSGACALNGEANLTFDGTTLTLVNGSCRQVLVPEGTAGKPSIAFACDTNTGIYGHPCGSDQMWFSVGGTGRAVVLTTGLSVQGTGKLEVQPTAKIHVDGGGDTFIHESAGNTFDIEVGGGQALRLNSNRGLFINETVDGKSGAGAIVANQDAADDPHLMLKSSDVAHAITDEAETDTYGLLKKAAAGPGGLQIRGLADTAGNYGMLLDGINVGNVDVDKSTGSAGYITIRAQLKSSNSVGVVGANQNLLVVRNHTTSRFILDADGDSHQDVGTAWTNFDDFNDLEVMDSIRMTLDRDPLGRGFVESLESRRELLEAMPGKPIVTFNNDGHHFVNTSRLAMLHHGAILQMNANLTERVSDLEVQIQELKALEGK